MEHYREMPPNSQSLTTMRAGMNPTGKPQASALSTDNCRIPQAALLRVIQGVAVATKASDEDVAPISQLVSARRADKIDTTSRSNMATSALASQVRNGWGLSEWHDYLVNGLVVERSRQLATLAVCVAYLRQQSREDDQVPISSGTMTLVWKMIYGVLTHPGIDPPLCTAMRSAQGFLSVALCSLIENGNIDELFRFHVWLPDGMRGNPDFAIHSHQPFAQSWILAGEGTDLTYHAEPVEAVSAATHAKFVPAWSDGKNLSSTYKTHQTISVVANTRELVYVRHGESATHSRDMTYTVPSAQFHTSVVPGDRFHSTFFFFDAQRGFEKNASVLGPIDGDSFMQQRDPAGTTASALGHLVEATRSWEVLTERAATHAQHGRLEEAANRYKEALTLCTFDKGLPNHAYYRTLTQTALSEVEKQMEAKEKPWLDRPVGQLPVSVAGI